MEKVSDINHLLLNQMLVANYVTKKQPPVLHKQVVALAIQIVMAKPLKEESIRVHAIGREGPAS